MNVVLQRENGLPHNKEAVLAELNRYPFTPPFWLRNPHAQTIWGAVARRPAATGLREERWETPDGDFLDMVFLAGEPRHPTVLILHGLEGCAQSSYIKSMLHIFQHHHWPAVVMQHRSCSGEINRMRQMYNAGFTGDVDFVVRRLLAENGVDRVCIAGFSLGGNIAAKWLGEQGSNLPAGVTAAALISSPYDLTAAACHIDRALFGLYTKRFLRSLIPKAVAKHGQYPGIVDIAKVRASKTFEDFDTHATAALHGYRDAFEYWADASCERYLGEIKAPLLCINALDDPFIPAETLPHTIAKQSPYVHGLFPARGGHVGFIQAHRWSWAEEQVLRFFQAVLSN
ncbi:MAG: alpha/beta fold hydrolase [Candidatus Hydrogenedentes bacterium]|nr:alpha/beta fold hydrolase [Candidatus Hydrogenedentota bacterium]